LFAPWFLAGLAAIGLPLWLHLLERHRRDPLKFPSLQLFERRTETSVRQRRLKYRWLLALRILMLALLALLFANPFVRRDPAAAGGSKLVLLAIDHSFSMRAEGALDRAKQQAAAQVERIVPGDLGEVVGLSGTAHLLTQATADKAELKAAIASIAPSDGRNSFAELARVAGTITESRKIPLEVHLFSDVQRTAMPGAFAELALPAGTSLIIHAVRAETPNYFVESVTAPSIVGDPKKSRVTAVVGGSQTAGASKTVSLVLNGKTVASRTVSLAANGRAPVEFIGWDAPYSWTRGEVRIDGADALAGDDLFRFTFERADPRKVLFVHEAGRPRSPLYFRAALEAAAEGLFALDPKTAGETAGVELAGYAFVVLSDTGGLPPAFEERLKKFVETGGGVLVAAAGSTAAKGAVPVWGARITETRYASRTAERFFSPSRLDLAHPVLARANKLEGVKVIQAVRIESAGGAVAARLNDGTPLLIDTKLGEGRVLTFASGFDNLSNDLPLHASFVPFVEQAARYLAQIETRPATMTVDAFVDLRAASSQGQAAAEIIDPDGKRVLDLKEAAQVRSHQLSAAGYWEIVRASSRREVVAANPNRAESDLAPAPAEALDLWRKTGSAGGETATPGQVQDRKPVSMWWYVALLLLMAMLAESVVASRHLEPGSAR
jgi:hypothetical protein